MAAVICDHICAAKDEEEPLAMPKPLSLALALLLLLAPASFKAVQADALAERRALAEDLFEEVLFDQMMDQIIDAMLPIFRTALQQNLAEKGIQLDEATLAKIETIMREETASSMLRMKPSIIDIYAQVMSREELSAFLEFYRTPAGASAMRKVPLLVQAMSPLMTQQMTQMAPTLQQRLATEVFAPQQ